MPALPGLPELDGTVAGNVMSVASWSLWRSNLGLVKRSPLVLSWKVLDGFRYQNGNPNLSPVPQQLVRYVHVLGVHLEPFRIWLVNDFFFPFQYLALILILN